MDVCSDSMHKRQASTQVWKGQDMILPPCGWCPQSLHGTPAMDTQGRCTACLGTFLLSVSSGEM